ncbi:DNA damage-inducible protein 1-like [Schistocerca americana]|uniref:DNA damage-inducible protein 1-like n=1 Tax=Schistocerca americana TaxID=7009 RepID=UPI001F4F992E|nr:DNA damage-inducible protein 1-like [Schistocerca americana]
MEKQTNYNENATDASENEGERCVVQDEFTKVTAAHEDPAAIQSTVEEPEGAEVSNAQAMSIQDMLTALFEKFAIKEQERGKQRELKELERERQRQQEKEKRKQEKLIEKQQQELRDHEKEKKFMENINNIFLERDKEIVRLRQVTEANNEGNRSTEQKINMMRYQDGNRIEDELYQEPAVSDKPQRENIQASVTGAVNRATTSILLDTGAYVSVMNTQFFKKVSEIRRLPILPVANCKVIGALGKKAQSVKYQGQVEVSLGNDRLLCTFLPMDNLSIPVLLGLDFLREMEAVIDLARGTCSLKYQQRPIT